MKRGRATDASVLVISAQLQETERLWNGIAALLDAGTQSPCLALCRLICERSLYLAYIVHDVEHVEARAEDYLLAGYRGLANALGAAGAPPDLWDPKGTHLVENGPMANYLEGAVRRYGEEIIRRKPSAKQAPNKSAGGRAGRQRKRTPEWYGVENGPDSPVELAARVDPKADGFSLTESVRMIQRICSEYVHGSFDFVDIHQGTEEGPLIVRHSYDFSGSVLLPTVRNVASVHMIALAKLCKASDLLDASMIDVLGRLDTSKG